MAAVNRMVVTVPAQPPTTAKPGNS
jgi:hypothetical protein